MILEKMRMHQELVTNATGCVCLLGTAEAVNNPYKQAPIEATSEQAAVVAAVL